MTAYSIHLRPPLADLVVDVRATENLEDALVRECDNIRDRQDVSAVLLGFETGVATVHRQPERASSFRCLELLPQPVIAVLDGAVAGVALELALACDMRVAAASSRFSMPQVGEGTVPSSGGTQRLPRLIGRARATELLLLGETIDAQTALACGLVNAVEPDAASAKRRAEAIAMRIAERGPIAVRYAKEAMVRGLEMPLEQALRYETDLTVILQTTDDRGEGVKAFLDKRPPEFRGV